MNRILLIAAVVVMGASANAVVFYNKLGQSYDNGNGDWDGGASDFGANYGLELGQRVNGGGGGTITDVTGRFLMFTNNPNNGGALVQVFKLSGNTVGAMVGQQGGVATMTSMGNDTVFGLQLVDVKMTGLSIAVSAGQDYLVAIQGRGGNWGYIARSGNGAQNTFVRDYSAFGNGGGYGTTDWTLISNVGYADGDANMLVNGVVPEPASLLAIGAGLAALAARRRRK